MSIKNQFGLSAFGSLPGSYTNDTNSPLWNTPVTVLIMQMDVRQSDFKINSTTHTLEGRFGHNLDGKPGYGLSAEVTVKKKKQDWTISPRRLGEVDASDYDGVLCASACCLAEEGDIAIEAMKTAMKRYIDDKISKLQELKAVGINAIDAQFNVTAVNSPKP